MDKREHEAKMADTGYAKFRSGKAATHYFGPVKSKAQDKKAEVAKKMRGGRASKGANEGREFY